MERMITERMVFYLGSRGILSPHQSGFGRGRGTMDPIICLETGVKKAQVNKESGMAVFFDVGKSIDMMSITGIIYNWIKDFLADIFIQVRIGKVLSGRYMVKNGHMHGASGFQ